MLNPEELCTDCATPSLCSLAGECDVAHQEAKHHNFMNPHKDNRKHPHRRGDFDVVTEQPKLGPFPGRVFP